MKRVSWLPQTLEVKVLRPWPEPGVNLGFCQTLRTNRDNVMMWRPVHRSQEIHDRSVEIQRTIAAGAPKYRAISTASNLLVSDCVHAVGVDPDFGRRHYPLIRIGKPASRYIAREIMTRSPAKGIDQESCDNSWLIPRLGLDRYPIELVPPQRIPRQNCVLCQCPE